MLLDRVVSALQQRGIEFALIGASALALRGVVRSTHDIDLMTTHKEVLGFDWPALMTERASVATYRGDFDDPLAGTVRIDEGEEHVDVVVAKWNWQTRIIGRAEPMSIGGSVIGVPDAADLVLLKVDAGSHMDLHDAGQLIEVHGINILETVRQRLEEVPPRVAKAFERFEREVQDTRDE